MTLLAVPHMHIHYLIFLKIALLQVQNTLCPHKINSPTGVVFSCLFLMIQLALGMALLGAVE